MKKLLLASVFAFTLITVKAQIIIDTVSVGAGYADQKWYSLENDEQGTTQSKDNWDIAFEITGYSASILANTQKANFMVYKAPYSVANYGTIDTTGINSWQKLYNSDTTWAIGAFNKGGVFANPNYLGWGAYDVNTHIVTGDSCYVIKLSNTVYKKFKIDNLAGGIYTATYADINGANSQTITINKTSYTGKNFAYYDLTTNNTIDREPTSATWDLTFGRYTAFLPPNATPYPVVGVLSNKGVRVAQADNIVNPTTYANWSSHPFITNMSEIGSDWKTFDLANNAWRLVNDTVYFVRSKSGDIWKLRFTGFGGSTNGDVILSKEKLSSVGINEIADEKIASLTVYPNPSNQDFVNIIYNLESQVKQASIKVYSLTGQEVFTENLNDLAGLNNYLLNTTNYNKGIYLIKLYVDGKVATQKLIKQ